MKKSLIMILTAIVIVFTSCVKRIEDCGFSDVTVLKGRVIEETGHTPLSGIDVSVTNGTRTYASYNTGNDGCFEMEINFNDIDKDYYLFLSGKGRNKKFELKGMGQEMYDFRDVAFYKSDVPTVTTKDPMLTGNTVTTGGDVTDDGGETVTERGVCYGTLPYPDVTCSHISSGSGTGSYTSTFDIKQNNVTYYIRAYATNANGTNYGEQKTVAKLDLPTFQYNGSTYYVAPDPGILMSNFGEANSYCENYGIYGTMGWTLPTIDELTEMYAKRESIGGFESTCYYSSTKYDSYWYYVLAFSDGRYYSDYYYYARVRPIKKIN